MADGFSTSDAVLTSAMSGGFNGNRGGAWGNSGCGAPFADPGSNAVRINRNMAVSEANDRCIKEVTDANMDRLSDQAEEGRRTAASTATNKNIVDSEFRNIDRITSLSNRVIDGQKDAAKTAADAALAACKCCADNALAMAQMEARLTKQADDNFAKITERELNAANARVTQLTTIDAITSRCGCCSTPS